MPRRLRLVPAPAARYTTRPPKSVQCQEQPLRDGWRCESCGTSFQLGRTARLGALGFGGSAATPHTGGGHDNPPPVLLSQKVYRRPICIERASSAVIDLRKSALFRAPIGFA